MQISKGRPVRESDKTKAPTLTSPGPLVYPAGHVMIYNALYRVTEGGSDILRAQCIFAAVYLAALGTVMACYRQAKVGLPPFGDFSAGISC